MKATIQNGVLTITIPCDEAATQPSKSLKTLLVATTHGAMASTATVKGKPVIVSLNAYIKP